MKRFLLTFIVILFSISTIYSQAPSNQDVTTATEINSFPFSESNIILDLSSNDTGEQAGCTFTGNPTIYYKFNAAQNAPITAQISDSSGSDLSFTSAAFLLHQTLM